MARGSAVLVAAAIVLLLTGVLPAAVAAVLLLAAVVVAWRKVPGFWPTAAVAALGGAFAGLLVLGPGLRVAMRAVAMADPLRVPELTVEGTAIVLMFGVVFGTVVGVVAALVRVGVGLSRRGSAAVAAALLIAFLVGEPGTRAELFELGAGAVVNIAMFALVCVAYGLAAASVTARIDDFRRRRRRRASMKPLLTGAHR